MLLKGKIAIVTGGASGIGESISLRFSEEGARVYILDLSTENKVLGAEVIRTDVSDQRSVRNAVKDITGGTGKVDILVNNAGIAHIGTAVTTDVEDLDRLYEANVKGVYNCLHEILPVMIKNGGGVILNMGSVISHVAVPERFAYAMTKGAVMSMTWSVAKDFINDNIRCNSISPARVHTPFVDGYLSRTYPGREKEMYDKLSASQPIGRMGKPEEIAELALFLCSDKAAFITGSDFPIDGGFIKLNT